MTYPLDSSKALLDPIIHVVVLNWNRPKDTIECLDSLVAQQNVILKITVVDNGSTDNSLEEIASASPQIEVISTGKNLGYAGGMNAGIQWVLSKGAAHILLLNNDTIADPLLAKYLLTGLSAQAEISAPLIFFADPPSKIWSTGGNINSLILEMMPSPLQKPKEAEVKTFFTGCALLVSSRVFHQIGGFDDRFYPGYYEDLDFCLRVKHAGIGMVLVPQAKLWHKVSQSSGGSHSPRVRFLMARNSARYFRKHMRWWQVPFITGFRLLSALKASMMLIGSDRKGFEAYWRGMASGWLGISSAWEDDLLGTY
jgi:GT2 family glycosyltransferase